MIKAHDVPYVGKPSSNLKSLVTVAKYLRQILLVLIDIRDQRCHDKVGAP